MRHHNSDTTRQLADEALLRSRRGGGSGGGVTAVTGSSPIASSGGPLPNISLSVAGQAQGDILFFDGTNWVRLPAGSPGSFLQTDGPLANPQWAPVAAGGWQTALDFDFTAQPNQSLATDGVHTIGGLAWTKINSVSDAAPMAIVAATGLQITPTAAADLVTGTSPA